MTAGCSAPLLIYPPHPFAGPSPFLPAWLIDDLHERWRVTGIAAHAVRGRCGEVFGDRGGDLIEAAMGFRRHLIGHADHPAGAQVGIERAPR
jgi:hypothetical protein